MLMFSPRLCALAFGITVACGSNDSSSSGDSGGAGVSGSGGSSASTGSGGSSGAPDTGGSTGATDGAGGSGTGASEEPVCTSDAWWTSGTGSSMRPGEPCLSCHTGSGAPLFRAAGTVYPTLHEPDDCKGTAAQGAVVVITGGDGSEHRATVNAAGNFYIQGGQIPSPWSARVERDGQSIEMMGNPESGNCNDCHTQSGDEGAPGRIHLP